jgi:hypothetical protein
MKKILIFAIILIASSNLFAVEKVLSREKYGCIGNSCAYTGRTLVPMDDWSGDGKPDWGVNISCSGAGFSQCPRSIAPPGGGNDGEWDECTIYACETLITYAENQINEGNNSGEHTIIVQSNGCSYTFKIVYSGDYSDENNCWDNMDIYLI